MRMVEKLPYRGTGRARAKQTHCIVQVTSVSQAFPPSFAVRGFPPVETFACEVIADNGAVLPLKWEVDQATGDAR